MSEFQKSNMGVEKQTVSDAHQSSSSTVLRAGQILQQLRESHNIHISELAAELKISENKLLALEQDDYSQLPDIAFVRSLAKKVCRMFNSDDQEVLALLPKLADPRLSFENNGHQQSIKITTKSTEAQFSRSTGLSKFSKFLIGLLFCVCLVAVCIYFWPMQIQNLFYEQQTTTSTQNSGDSGGVDMSKKLNFFENDANQVVADESIDSHDQLLEADSQLDVAQQSPEVAIESNPSDLAKAGDATQSAQELDDNAEAAELYIFAKEPVWMDITNVAGKTLYKGILTKGEEFSIQDTQGLIRLHIGRVDAVEVKVKGEPFDLLPFARSNVARVEINS